MVLVKVIKGKINDSNNPVKKYQRFEVKKVSF
jgi:hypothetical protein